MNKFKNPRLKHVKKIKKIAEKRMYWYPETFNMINKIIDQCNLLLETKKRKCTCTFIGKIDGSKKRISRGCSKHDKFYKFRDGEDILDQLNKLSQKQKPFAQEVSEFVNGNTDRPSPQPEKECNCKEIGNVCFHSKTNPQPNKCDLHRTLDCPYCFAPQTEIEPLRLESTNQLFMLTEIKINEVIDQLNKLTKTI